MNPAFVPSSICRERVFSWLVDNYVVFSVSVSMELQRFELGEGGLDTGRARDTLGNTIRSRSQIVVNFK